MAGCDTKNIGGDYGWGTKRVFLGWGGLGGTIGSAAALAAAPVWWAGVLGAVGGIIIGTAIGNAVEWFDRLKEQNPKTITISGLIVCAGRNTGYAGIPEFKDGDWTFNVANLTVDLPTGLSVDEVRTRAAPDWGEPQAFRSVDPDTGVDILHCEIGSHIGDFAAVGRAVGAVAGAIVGALIGCLVAGIFTFGLACLIAIVIGALVGAELGSLGGQGLGALADAWSDFDRRGKVIRKGCVMSLTGTWVTDASHQHNEIHDIERAQLIRCPVGSKSTPLLQAAVVGTGRQPADGGELF